MSTVVIHKSILYFRCQYFTDFDKAEYLQVATRAHQKDSRTTLA